MNWELWWTWWREEVWSCGLFEWWVWWIVSPGGRPIKGKGLLKVAFQTLGEFKGMNRGKIWERFWKSGRRMSLVWMGGWKLVNLVVHDRFDYKDTISAFLRQFCWEWSGWDGRSVVGGWNVLWDEIDCLWWCSRSEVERCLHRFLFRRNLTGSFQTTGGCHQIWRRSTRPWSFQNCLFEKLLPKDCVAHQIVK